MKISFWKIMFQMWLIVNLISVYAGVKEVEHCNYYKNCKDLPLKRIDYVIPGRLLGKWLGKYP